MRECGESGRADADGCTGRIATAARNERRCGQSHLRQGSHVPQGGDTDFFLRQSRVRQGAGSGCSPAGSTGMSDAPDDSTARHGGGSVRHRSAERRNDRSPTS